MPFSKITNCTDKKHYSGAGRIQENQISLLGEFYASNSIPIEIFCKTQFWFCKPVYQSSGTGMLVIKNLYFNTGYIQI